jgi:energy-coupling factor transport system substrate-specific component
VAEAASLLLVPVLLAVCAAVQIQQTMLVTTAAVVVSLAPFFIGLERDKLKARELMPIVVFAALAVAGRILFAPFPNVKPVSAIVIMAGLSFGRRSGFMTGALAALVSNLFFGQGAWTPWQMYAWGLMGYAAGALCGCGILKHKLAVFAYGALAPFGYALILDSYYIAGLFTGATLESVLAAYSLGLAFAVIHSLATLFFLIPIYLPWTRKLQRLKRKYGIVGS